MEVKKCPYCGGNAQIIKIDDLWLIKCTAIDCHVALYTALKTVEEAINLWNDECKRIISERTDNVGKKDSNKRH